MAYDNWQKSWPDPPPPNEVELDVVKEAKACLKDGEDFEAEARVRMDYDYKFAHGDTHNKYQWDADLVLKRNTEEKPILTINKVQQHNLLIINDSKQNKSGVRVRPVNNEASFEGAELYQELIYHIEYISGAENVYDHGITWQVEAGKGYWYVTTEYEDDRTFDQEIYVRQIKDPRNVYTDMNFEEIDGSDMRWGIIFEDIDKDLYKKKYRKFANVGGNNVLGSSVTTDGWISRDKIKIALFYRREEKEEKLVAFLDENGEQQIGYHSELTKEGKERYAEVKDDPTSQERDVVTHNVKLYKIAGDRIIEQTDWVGSTIPIVRLPGVETVIDGVYDCCGHTRALINPQQMYNYNSSANVEFIALQTKSPWVAASAAIEGYEEYYKTSNSMNHAYVPYNHIDDDGNEIPAPQRSQGVQSGMGYVKGLEISQNEMMMASGQYQSQMGENENAKSGVAINARQRQGDRSTYHFLDNQNIAIRRTGKIFLEVIPKVYDTKRIKKILGRDGTKMHITIDPEATQVQQQETINADKDAAQQIKQFVFNPTFGKYDLQSSSGPSYATQRQEAFAALNELAQTNEKFMDVGGDIYFKNADFPGADELSARYRRTIPPGVTGDAPPPAIEQVMQQAGQQIQTLQGAVAHLNQMLEDKDREMTLREQEFLLQLKKTGVVENRLDYDSETKRLTALGNAGPGISIEQIQAVVKQLLAGMIANGELTVPALPGPQEGGTIPSQLEPAPGASAG